MIAKEPDQYPIIYTVLIYLNVMTSRLGFIPRSYRNTFIIRL